MEGLKGLFHCFLGKLSVKPVYYFQVLINKMLRHWVVVVFLLFSLNCTQIQLNLKQTEATLYTNDQVVLKFNVEGGEGKKTIQFLGIPTTWIQNKNDLVISNFTIGQKQQWSFQIYIEDQMKNFLRQTIRLVFEGFNVELNPVTLPVTGNLNDKEKANQQGFNINQLIQQYPGIQQSEFGINYENNTEITQYLIANAQAQYDPSRDGRIITEQQILRNAAIQRQINADKAIANLVGIIQQLTADVNVIKEELSDYDQEVKDIRDDFINCQEEQFSLENIRAKILNAVNDKRVKMKQYQNQISINVRKISTLEADLLKLKTDRIEIEKKSTPNNRELQKLEEILVKCDSVLDDDKNRIQSILNSINKNNAEIGILETQISESKERVLSLNSNLQKVRVKIASLKKQLVQAETEEKQIVKEASYYRRVPTEGEKKIQQLKSQNNNYYRTINRINQQIRNKIKECEEVKKELNQIRNKLTLSKFNYQALATLIEDKEFEIRNLKEVVLFFRENSARIPIELAALEVQLNKYQERIKRQKFLCGVTQEDLQKAQMNRQAIYKKFQRDEKALKNAKKNLQKARVQKQLADFAVNQLSRKTGALPFPQQKKSQYPVVSDLGNNFRAGTPSDPRNAVNITNINDYISANFRFTVERNNTPILYPMSSEIRSKIVSSVSSSAGLSSFACQRIRTNHFGTIQRISIGTVEIRNQRGLLFSASISKCTIISSTSSQIFFRKGTKVYFSGNQLFGLPGTTLFDAYELLLIPN